MFNEDGEDIPHYDANEESWKRASVCMRGKGSFSVVKVSSFLT